MPSKQGSQQQEPNSRAIAATVLDQILQHKGSLATELGGRKRIPIAVRGEVQEFCYGVMRWYFELDGVLQQLLNKPLRKKDGDVRALLLMGLYQSRHMRVPEHASVSETVAAAGALNKLWAKGLINAVLRNHTRQRDELEKRLTPAQVAAYPNWLFKALYKHWPDNAPAVMAASNERPSMTLRVNAHHHSVSDYVSVLTNNAIAAKASVLANSGVELDRPMDVVALPGFDCGWASVQDSSAQLAADLLEIEDGQRILDACCAPGGKTGHILELGKQIKLDAVDNEERRLQKVRDTLDRLGLTASVRREDAAKASQWTWPEDRYDRILLDVPCSATGVIRRNPDIKFLRRSNDLDALHHLQATILAECWQQLKPGGKLLYVTCSILPEENQQIIAAFVETQSDATHDPILASWGEPCSYGRQLLPAQHDGFYYCRLQKNT